jgi:hypothetical protein
MSVKDELLPDYTGSRITVIALCVIVYAVGLYFAITRFALNSNLAIACLLSSLGALQVIMSNFKINSRKKIWISAALGVLPGVLSALFLL